MSFWRNAFTTVLNNLSEKMSALNPVNNLIKYVIDRTFNEILSNKISIQKFKNGELILPDVQLNIQKINSEYLLSSPYILHSGKTQTLKIIMPHCTKLATQSIELILKGLQLQFIPNKNFAQNYRQTMTNLMEDQIMDPIIQGGQTIDTVDFFRSLVKQMFTNLKITLEDTVIKQFINCPSQTPASKYRYYLMYRIPKLYIGKSNDFFQKKNNVQEEQFKFDFLLPHLSVHLLRQGIQIPEFGNQAGSPKDYPLKYPTVNHPGTLLLIGKSDFLNQKEVTKLTISIKINYKEEKKIFNMKGNINFLEATLDPVQLKIISRFVAQISQFQKIVKMVYAEFSQDPTTNEGVNLNRRSSKDSKSFAVDLFTSFSLMISQPKLINASNKKHKAKPSIYQSMRFSKQMILAANQFNKQVVQQLKNINGVSENQQNQKDEYEGYRNILFKDELQANFQLGRLQINMLKFVTVSSYKRSWIADGGNSEVNISFGCPHYQFVLQKFNYHYYMDRHDLTMKEVLIHDVRLSNLESFKGSFSEQFYDVDEKDYGVSVSQNYFNERPILKEFECNMNQHYCMEELFRISEGQSPPYKTQKVTKYAFMPQIVKNKMGDGLQVSIHTEKKVLMAKVKQVAVMLNFQIWKDMLNIIYPIFLYKSFGERANLLGSQLKTESGQQPQQIQNTNLQNVAKIESQYNYEGKLLEQAQSKDSTYLINLKVNLLYCLYRQNQSIKSTVDFIEEVQKKILDSDNFSKNCFCNINERSIYAQLSNLQYDYIKGDFAFGIQKIKGGLLKITSSQIGSNNPFLIAENIRVEQFIGSNAQVFTRMFFPHNKFNVQLSEFITFIDMVRKSVYIVDSLLGFRRSLRSKMTSIQQKNTNEQQTQKKKQRKSRRFELYFGEIQLKMLLASVMMKGVYFYKLKRQMQIKFHTLAIGFIKGIQTQLWQCINDEMITISYPKTCKYPGIYDSNLILEIGRQNVYIAKKQKQTSAKIRLQFFEEMQKQKFSVCIFFNSNQTQKQHPLTMNKKAKLQKKQKTKLSKIPEEERHNQIINILLSEPVYLHVCNLTFLLQEKKLNEQKFQNFRKVISEIQRSSKEIIDTNQKQQCESEEEIEYIQNVVNIKGGQLLLDFRPDYSYDQTTKVRMLSNLRMVSIIQINQCKLSMNPDIQQYSLSLLVSLEGHFLHHEDKSLQLNPILICKSQLELLGFQNILNVDLLQIKGLLCLRQKQASVNCKIENINVKMCLSSMPILALFFQYFIQHHLKGNYGINKLDPKSFEMLNEKRSMSAQMVTDLDEEEQKLCKLIDWKNQKLIKFRDQQYAVNINHDDNNSFKFELKSLLVGKTQIHLLEGKQFKFDKSKLQEIKRVRSQFAQVTTHIFLRIKKVQVQAIIQQEKQIYCSFQSLHATYYFSRNPSILKFWGNSVAYEFDLIKVNIPLKALIQISKDYLKIKINKFELNSNLTDHLMTFIDQYRNAAQEIDSSLFKLDYPKQQVNKQTQMIMLLIPEGRITTSIQYKGINLISNRLLIMSDLTMNENRTNSESINSHVNEWLLSLKNNNMGTLISGVIFQGLSFCTDLIIAIIRSILGIIFPFI